MQVVGALHQDPELGEAVELLDARAFDRSGPEHGRIRVMGLEVLDDGQRLADDLAVVELEKGHLPSGFLASISGVWSSPSRTATCTRGNSIPFSAA